MSKESCDHMTFLWNLSQKLKRSEVNKLLGKCLTFFPNTRMESWSAFELFKNLMDIGKVKFVSSQQPPTTEVHSAIANGSIQSGKKSKKKPKPLDRRTSMNTTWINWVLLVDILNGIGRNDLAKEVDRFGETYQMAFMICKENKSKLHIENEIRDNNCLLKKGTYCECYDVAIKIFKQQTNEKDITAVQRKATFIEKAEMLLKIDHSNVLGHSDLFVIMRDNSPPCYVMTYFASGDLVDFFMKGQKESLDFRKIIHFAKEIATGMTYLHNQGIMHCNLKADNILVTDDNHIKISGLSSARAVNESITKDKDANYVFDLQEDVIIAIKWMPLEVLLHRQFCKTSDIWSYGIVLIEMFNYGQLPYEDLSNEATITFLYEGSRHEQPQNCPAGLYQDLLLKCWDINVTKRPRFDEITNILENNSEFQSYKRIVDVARLNQSLKNTNNRKSFFLKPNISIKHSRPNSIYPEDLYLPTIGQVQKKDLTLMKILGSGEFGYVYEAILNHNGKNLLVAAKTFNSQTTTMEEFSREVEIMKYLRHPNIVHMIGVCKHEESMYLITEIMANGSLLQLLREDKEETIKQKDLLKIAYQICKAMKYLEQKSITHRDLAARNVLASKDKKNFKISDFGMSMMLNGTHSIVQNAIAIPVRWAAPEVLLRNNFELKSDVWSFGIFLVELFTYGEIPYQEWNLHEVINNVLDGSKHRQPRYCIDQIYTIMCRCWCMEPSNRPTFAELYNSIETLLDTLFGIYLTLDKNS